jgi:hypothetical protein
MGWAIVEDPVRDFYIYIVSAPLKDALGVVECAQGIVRRRVLEEWNDSEEKEHG